MERKRERSLLSVEVWQTRSACSLMRGQAHIDQHFTCNTNGVCLSKCLSGFAFTALQIQKPVAPVEFLCVCARSLFMWTVGMNVAVERETTKLNNRSGGF